MLLQLSNYALIFVDPLSQRGIGRMAAETPEIGMPLHKEIPFKTGFDIEQPLWIGERQEPEKV